VNDLPGQRCSEYSGNLILRQSFQIWYTVEVL
jgi:hypothetical protein